MRKINDQEEVQRMDEYESILRRELALNEISDIELIQLFMKIIKYLKHNRNDRMLGRSSEKLEENIHKYISFCKKIGFSNKDIVSNIENFVSILHIFSDNFMYNYYLCNVLENDSNTFRREKLKKRAKDFMVDYKRTYARLMFMESIGYKPSWDNLLKRSDDAFASLFVKDDYSKPHKIFSSKDELTRDELLKRFPVDEEYMDRLSKETNNNVGFSDEYGTK